MELIHVPDRIPEISETYQPMHTSLIQQLAQEAGCQQINRVGNARHHLIEWAIINEGGEQYRIGLLQALTGNHALKLYAGAKVWACLNMTISAESVIKLHHRKHIDDRALRAFNLLVNKAYDYREKVEKAKQITLDRLEAWQLSDKCFNLRHPEGETIENLATKKPLPQQSSSSLWDYWNTVQRHLMQGGYNYQVKDKRRAEKGEYPYKWMRARPITNLDRRVKLNVAMDNILTSYIQ